jgi:hypothetical protein
MNGSVDAILYQRARQRREITQLYHPNDSSDEKQVYQAFANRIEGSCASDIQDKDLPSDPR